jgi:uncharacterized membrane protein YeaQ/YmgE (transglycosylase-associated protein family)
MMMNAFSWVVLGLIAGCIAAGTKMNKRGESPLLDISVCIGGALVGGLLFSAFRTAGATAGFDVWSLVFAAVGSAISLAVWHEIRASKARA